MKSVLQNPLLLFLAVTTVLAAPVITPDALLPRHETSIRPRQQNFTQPVSFKTVTTTQTEVGVITETCDVSLSPITGSDGAQLVREDKKCTYLVTPSGESPPPPPSSGGESDTASSAPPNQTDTQTSTDGQATTTTSDNAVTTTTSDTAGAGSTSTSTGAASVPSPPVSGTETSSLSTSGPSAPTTSATASPNTSESANESASESASASAPAASTPSTAASVTITSTLSNGSLTTLTTIPTAAQAQESAQKEEVPGRKLEVLPIGLGVFAGISVIALIVVGLVTYERTKYRKAFRQRKLAEAGANMGYGGMADRT